MPGYSSLSTAFGCIFELLYDLMQYADSLPAGECAELLWWQCQWYGCCCLQFEFARFIAYSHTKNTQLHINLKRDYSIFHYTVIISLSLSPSNDTLCIDDIIVRASDTLGLEWLHVIFIIRKFMNVFLRIAWKACGTLFERNKIIISE